MKKQLILAAMMLLMGASSQSQALTLANLGFETGNLSGWTVYGGTTLNINGYPTEYGDAAQVKTNVTAVHGTKYIPPYGNYMAALFGNFTAGQYSTLSQNFSINAGETISGKAAFLAHDYLPFNDDAYVKIFQNGQLIDTRWINSVSGVGDLGDSGWQNWSWTAKDSGIYTLQFGARNVKDATVASIGLFDMPVPEPSSMLLGLLGLGGAFARKRKAA